MNAARPATGLTSLRDGSASPFDVQVSMPCLPDQVA